MPSLLDSPLPVSAPAAAPVGFDAVLGRSPKIAWIVSSGGHLTQAMEIERLIGVNPDSVWITNASTHAGSALEGRRTVAAPYVAPRDVLGSARAALLARRVLREESFDHVVSTGAAVAGLALPLARLLGHAPVFVESVARRRGPSLTGRIAKACPGVAAFAQSPFLVGRGWGYIGSVLGGWEPVTVTGATTSGPRRVFVTLGTIRPYRFDRAVEAVLAALRPDDQVVWQLGATTRADLPGEVHDDMPVDDVRRAIREADVVVTHSGFGTVFECFRAGKAPVLVVRERVHDEHVDDHQRELAHEVAARGLGLVLDLAAPSAEILDGATSRGVRGE